MMHPVQKQTLNHYVTWHIMCRISEAKHYRWIRSIYSGNFFGKIILKKFWLEVLKWHVTITHFYGHSYTNLHKYFYGLSDIFKHWIYRQSQRDMVNLDIFMSNIYYILHRYNMQIFLRESIFPPVLVTLPFLEM